MARNTAFAVLCITLVVFSAFLPGTSSDSVFAILIPLGVVAPAVAAIILRREASRCNEQPASLLSLVLLRAPPSRTTSA